MDPQDLQLVGIAPLLCDDVFASAGAQLRLHIGGNAAAPGAAATADQVSCGCTAATDSRPPARSKWHTASVLLPLQLQAPPRVDLDGEGLFCLTVVCLAGGGQQELCWCVSNIPDYEFGLGLQASERVCWGTGAPGCAPAVTDGIVARCRLAVSIVLVTRSTCSNAGGVLRAALGTATLPSRAPALQV